MQKEIDRLLQMEREKEDMQREIERLGDRGVISAIRRDGQSEAHLLHSYSRPYHLGCGNQVIQQLTATR